MKTDYLNAKILSHRANLHRHATLLATQLTELERKYLHKRIEEDARKLSVWNLGGQPKPRRRKKPVTVPNPGPASPPVPPGS
jgi:hypothetical protein